MRQETPDIREKLLADRIAALPQDKSYVIALCGLPGSGKSTLADKLANYFLPRALRVSEDDFCVVPTERRKKYLATALAENNMEKLRALAVPTRTADNPYANPLTWYDWQEFGRCLQQLKSGIAFDRAGCWNQQTGACDRHVHYVPPSRESCLYFVDTNYPFEVENWIDMIVLVDASKQLAAKGQAQRDSHRSDTAYLAYKQIVGELYCAPYTEKVRGRADFVIQRREDAGCTAYRA